MSLIDRQARYDSDNLAIAILLANDELVPEDSLAGQWARRVLFRVPRRPERRVEVYAATCLCGRALELPTAVADAWGAT